MAETAARDAAILGALDMGLIVLDEAQTIVTWNRWMESATGRAQSQVVGQTLQSLFPDHDLTRLRRAVADAITLGASRLLGHALNPHVLPLRTRTGRAMVHDAVVAPVGDAPFTHCLVQIADVTVADERERVLRERQNARYTAVVDNAPDAIFTVDQLGMILQANPAAARELGYSLEELHGRALSDLIEEQNAWAVVLADALGGRPQQSAVELTGRRSDGSITFLEASAARWLDQSKPFVSVILRDVNARHAADIALRAQHATAEASLLEEQRMSELRDQFIAVLGHDLRNPLASIDSGIRILLRDPGPERALTISTMMQRSVLRMATLIDNVLDFARGRLGGGLTLHRKVEPLEPVLDQVVDELRSSWPERQIDAAWSLGGPIDCDHARVGQLFSNLLGNALTHGVATRPVIARANYAEANLEISVSNPGKEIPATVLQGLFRPFARGDISPHKQGLGLGLFISSEIAKAHGGDLIASSTDGDIRFIFRMPVN